MSAKKLQPSEFGTVILVIRYQGNNVVEDQERLRFEQSTLIPIGIMKILEFIKGVMAAHTLNSLQKESLVFEIHPHVTRPGSGSSKEWLATLETTQPLSIQHQQEFHTLACHVLARITQDNEDLFSRSVSESQSEMLDMLDYINEPIEKFLKTHSGRPLAQSFSVSADLHEQNPIIISGRVAEAQPREFVSVDISGSGLVDGFRTSKNEVFIFPILNNRLSGDKIEFLCSDPNIYRVLAEAYLAKKTVTYKARTIPGGKQQGKNQKKEVLFAEIAMDEQFELE